MMGQKLRGWTVAELWPQMEAEGQMKAEGADRVALAPSPAS